MKEAAASRSLPDWRAVPDRLLRRAQAGAALLRARARLRWHRSLQLRVVTTTLVVSAVVVAVLGFFLMQQRAASLIAGKTYLSDNQASEGLEIVEHNPGIFANLTFNTPVFMQNLVGQLEARGGASGDYGVAVLLPPGKQGPPVFSAGSSAGFTATSLPPKLVREVGRAAGSSSPVLHYVPAALRYGSDGPGQVTPGLLFGAPFGNHYQLYYFFPLTQEQRQLASDERTLALVGLALVFLLAAIASLVTRWVVVPVQQAARASQRLATGHLGDRLPVRGTDELAALATSFNAMAEGLQEKMAELEGLSQVQRQFVSDVSHELRTPMTTIRMAAEVLIDARHQLPPEAGRSAELLQSQLERFESLLIDLLEISRYDARAATLDAEPVDLCDLVRHCADGAQQLAERRGTNIEFRLPPEPVVAEVDRRRVARILRNLLVNAVEHGEDKDTVVTVAGDSVAVAVAVRDFGIGLAPGTERQVFDRFWRADPARARTTGGTGLGLAIALADAQLHGGWLEAWGKLGRGSVFRLTLPRAAGQPLAGSPLPLHPDDADLGTVSGALATIAGSAGPGGLAGPAPGPPAPSKPANAVPGRPPGSAPGRPADSGGARAAPAAGDEVSTRG